MNRRTGTEKLTLQSLVFLRAHVSYTRTAALVHTKRSNLVHWARLYNQAYGLELLVKPPMIAPLHERRIKAFLDANASQFRSLMSGEDMELYADWADVPSEMLEAWIIQREYYGEKQQKPFVGLRKRSYNGGIGKRKTP